MPTPEKMVVQIHDQTNILPRAKLLIVFAALASTMLITYIDQSAIGVALPAIGKDLNSSSTIVWAGTSSMIGNTVFQVLYGRLSDIFGRKHIMIAALGLLTLADLLCGFAKSGPQLYGFRGLAGVANGGIMAICMMIVSDVVTLEERGKYKTSNLPFKNIILMFLKIPRNFRLNGRTRKCTRTIYCSWVH